MEKTTKKEVFGLTKRDFAVWALSSLAVCVSFFAFGSRSYLTLTASLVGVASLIFNAKGNPRSGSS